MAWIESVTLSIQYICKIANAIFLVWPKTYIFDGRLFGGGIQMFKFKLKNGITGTATPVGTMHKVVFSNGVETKVDNTLVEKYLSNGTWQKK